MALEKNRISFEFDPFEELDVTIPKGRLNEAKSAVADFVRDSVLDFVGHGTSPVRGGDWTRKLTPDYRKRKESLAGEDFANMELTGAMLDSLEVVSSKGTKLRLQITGKKQVAKADGHNNFSGDSELPLRQFIPNEDNEETFKDQIWRGIKNILREFESEEADKSDGDND